MKLKTLTLGLLTVISTSLASADQARFLLSDAEAIQARVDILQQAKKEILVEYFSVWNDDQSLGGMALLIEAAKRGVKVRVMLDSLSSKVPLPMYAALMDKALGPNGERNLEVKLYNPMRIDISKLTHRDHAKMIIVDGEILLTGGRNVGDKYFGINTKRNFSDLDILLKGSVVKAARQNFIETWNSGLAKFPYLTAYAEAKIDPIDCMMREDYEQCRSRQQFAISQIKKEEERLKVILANILSVDADDIVHADTNKDWFAESVTIPDNNVRFMSHGTESLVSKETAHLSKELLEILKSAKSDVNIVSPYLIPTDSVMEAFRHLIQDKKVRVRVITNSLKSTDNLFAQAGYRYLKDKMVKMGVEIWEYNGPNTIHAKTALIDNQQILIGTYNMDPRSGFLNREIGVSLTDTAGGKLANELAQIIEHFRSKSTLTGKDGQDQNVEWQMDGVSASKKAQLKALHVIMPLIMNQL